MNAHDFPLNNSQAFPFFLSRGLKSETECTLAITNGKGRRNQEC